MYVAEVFKPGTWLDLADKDLAFELGNMLHQLEDRLAEAAIALTMFESSMQQHHRDPRAEWDADAKLRQEVDDSLRQEVGHLYYQDYERFRIEGERRALMRRAERGIPPRSYAHKVPFMHAHSFVYAVDSFGRFLDELCDYNVIPEAVRTIRDGFNDRLPMVRKIRNSAVHAEDRSRGFGSADDKRKGKKMQVTGFLGLSNLEGNNLCYTIDDGSYQRVAITADTLSVLVETLNKALLALPWKGPASISPR
jgi:hypothetical protein